MLNFDKNIMLEKANKALNNIRNLKKKTKEIICIGTAVLTVGSFVMYDAVAGIAYASGNSRGVLHVIKAGEKEIAVLHSKDDAKQTIENVKFAYGKVNLDTTAIVTPALSIEEKEYITAEQVTPLNATEATNKILAINESSEPLFKVYVNQSSVKSEIIPYDTVEVETDELEKGETKVKEEGQNGVKLVTSNDTLVNGKVEKSEVITSKVEKEASSEVILIGTKEKEEEKEETANTRNSSSVSSSSSRASSYQTPTFSSSSSAYGGGPNAYVWGQCTWGVKSAAPWVGSYWGNAGNWANSARAAGFSVGYTPVPGAVAVWPGHVALVTGVSGDQILVMEANYAGNPTMKQHRGWFNPNRDGYVSYIYPPQ